ncbi:MAG: hypothetical protein R3B54_16625 [Bdellovibrionota bacterium]
MEKIGDAVEFLHESGVVHRDLKAANVHLVVLYKDPETGLTTSKDGPNREIAEVGVLLGDFDLSSQKEVLHPSVDGITGTAAYMPADQVFQKTPSPEHDVYAMRKVFAEMALGHKITSEEMEHETYEKGFPSARMIEFRHSLESRIGPFKAMVVHHPTKSIKELRELAALAEKYESSGKSSQEFVAEYAKEYLLPLMEKDPEQAAEVIFTSQLLTAAFRENLGTAKANGLGMDEAQSKKTLAALSAHYGGVPKREDYTITLNVPKPEGMIPYRAPNPYVDWDQAHLAIGELKLEGDTTYVDPKSVGILPIVDGSRTPKDDINDDAPTKITRPRVPQNP